MVEAKRTPSFCTQCRSRCGCVAVVCDGRLVGIEPLPGHPTGDKLCPKGRAAPDLVYHPDRITRPLRRTQPKGAADPGWVAIAWDEALTEIAARMGAIRDRHGPEQVAFSVTTPSGSHIQDCIAWIERFIRAYGSPNTIYATEICNWHKDYAARFTYGHDIGTPDFVNAECILLWGNNPATTWLARLGEVQKALRRGAKLVVVDPRPTILARRATRWLQVRPGADQALALGLIHLLISTDRFDERFVRTWTNGSFLVRSDTGHLLRESDLRAGGSTSNFVTRVGAGFAIYDAARGRWLDGTVMPALRWAGTFDTLDGPVACQTAFDRLAQMVAEYPPERVAGLSGVAPDDLAAAADVIAGSGLVAYFAWNGVGQSVTATQTDRAISILYALTGSYGGKGGNVPGGAAPFTDISGQDLLSPTQKAKALGLDTRPLGPGLNGWVTARDVYRAVLAQAPYPVRMLLSFGTNVLVSQPDTETARRALAALEFHVHADFFVNATARYADIVLPVATSWEREGLRAGFDVSLDGLRRVQLRQAAIAPVGEARSDTDIVVALAGRLGLSDQMFDGDVNKGHDAVLGKVGLSVADLRASPAGVVVDSSISLDAHAIESDGSPRGFPTPTRKIELYSERLLLAGYPPVPALAADDAVAVDARYPLRLGGAKTVAFCHSQHRNIAALRRLVPDPVVEIAPADASARGIAQGDWVSVETERGTFLARATLVAGLAPGAVFGQHGWWVEGAAGTPYDWRRPLAANINNAIATERADPVSGSLPLRCSWCEIARIDAPT